MWNPLLVPPNTPEYTGSLIWLSVVILTGVISNLVLLVTVVKTKYVSGHASGVLLLALCLVDLYVVFFSAPLYLISTVYNQHLFGDTGCLVAGYLDNTVSFIGLWCISSSSIDRLVAVSQPLVYKQIVKKGRSFIVLVSICVISAGASSLIFFANKKFLMCDNIDQTEISTISLNNLNNLNTTTEESLKHYSVYVKIYQIIHSVVPLSVSLLAYIGIFLSARNLRTREVARKKVLDKMNRRRRIAREEEDDEIVEISSSIESGIDMEGSMTFSDRSDDEDLPIERRPRSTTSSGRRSMVVNNEVRRSKGSIKFSNTTVFMESLHNTFFNSNLMEELNKLHEDYFSLSQFETERTDTTDLETPDLSPEQGLQNIDPILMNFPNNVAQVFRWPKKKERSVTERLQIKTAILLAAVVVIIVGSHVPTLIFELSDSPSPVTGRFSLLLPLVVYSVNPLLFGFLNNTLRTKAVELVVDIFRKPESQVTAESSNTMRRRDSMAAFKRFGRRISLQAALLREFKIKRINTVGPLEMLRSSDMSILSQRSVIRDQMTLKYFETNL